MSGAKPAQHRGARLPDVDADICIVGATVAGLACALSLALRGRSVVILDVGEVAPLRGSGLVRAGFGRTAAALSAAGERQAVRRIHELSAAAARSADRLMEALGLEPVSTGLIALPGPRGRLDLIDEVAARDDLALAELTRLAPETVAAALGTPAPFGALYDPHPATYDAARVPGLLATAARSAGVRLFEHTPVTATDLAGVRKYVETPTFRARAEHVVFATDRGLRHIAPFVAGAVVDTYEVRGVLTRTDRGERTSESVAEGGARGVSFAFDGSRLAFAAPTAGLVRGEVAAASVVRRHAARFYPRLRGAVVEGAYGLRIRSSRHGVPLIGSARAGVWYAVGLGPEPLATACLAADLIGDAIVARDDTIAAFAPFVGGSSFGFAGRLVRRAAYWAGRCSDAAARASALRDLPPPQKHAAGGTREGAKE